MRLQINRSKNAASLYIVESTYDRNKKRSNRIVKKLGTLEELSKVHEDPIAWGKEIARQMTEEDKLNKRQINISYNPLQTIPSDRDVLFDGGYLFLQKIFYRLGLDKICADINSRYKFEHSLTDILRVLLYGRVLFPSSKAGTYDKAKTMLENPSFPLHAIYNALSIFSKESDFIQSELYKNSKKVLKRNDRILYYDCTNYFFELEEAKGIRQYGASKEHRPNPIVQMGLFMDGDGIPLAYSINPGNTNEQITLKPLEKLLLKEFNHSQFVVCTDAGLSSKANRAFNSIQNRAFITVQSIKKMKDIYREWALEPEGWRIVGDNKYYSIEDIQQDEESIERYLDTVFYKELILNDDGIKQRYIVTFSLKYKYYLEGIRNKHLSRAQKRIDTGAIGTKRQSDPERFIQGTYFTEDGELANGAYYSLDMDKAYEESMYDGFYCVATNLGDNIQTILKVNRRRWEIEKSFRLLKSEFKARPVYLSRDDRIQAHFLTCFLALYIFRILEKELKEQYSSSEILSCLRSLKFMQLNKDSYIPAYKKTELTDALHDTFGFRTDWEIIKTGQFRKIIKETKKA